MCTCIWNKILITKCINIIVGLAIKTMTPLKHLPSLFMFNTRRLEWESQQSSCVYWQGLKGRQKRGKALQWKKRKAFSLLLLEVVDIGKLGRQLERGHPMWLVRGAYLAFYGGILGINYHYILLVLTYSSKTSHQCGKAHYFLFYNVSIKLGINLL